MLLTINSVLPISKCNSNLCTGKSNIKKQPAVSFTSKKQKTAKAASISSDKIFGENHTLNPIITRKLDESRFVFNTEYGPQLLSIKDMIAQTEHREAGESKIRVYKGCGSEEEIDDIIENGFDTVNFVKLNYEKLLCHKVE